MPLSEEELRLLEQMERALSEEDPKFASTLRGTTIRQAARRRAILAGVVFVVGIVVMMGGAITHLWAIGVVGFLIMLISATVLLSSLRGQRGGAAAPMATAHPSGFGVIDGGRRQHGRNQHGRNQQGRGHQRSSGFMDTLAARWRRRRDQGGF